MRYRKTFNVTQSFLFDIILNILTIIRVELFSLHFEKCKVWPPYLKTWERSKLWISQKMIAFFAWFVCFCLVFSLTWCVWRVCFFDLFACLFGCLFLRFFNFPFLSFWFDGLLFYLTCSFVHTFKISFMILWSEILRLFCWPIPFFSHVCYYIHCFVYSFVYLFVCIYSHFCIYLFICWLIYCFVYSFVCSFVHMLVCSLFH